MAAIVAQEEQPISRTYQYRKVMKPMLERKRRARINRCLDELKELLVGALQAEGESVSRLEKADVLELTVRHLHKLRRSQQLTENGSSDKFKSGFIQCANEVSKYMTTLTSTVDLSVSSRLLAHLDGCIRHIEVAPGSSSSPNSLLSPVSSCSSGPGGLNILTSYTPPASPISSPKNLNHAAAVAAAAHLNSANLLNHAKLFAYLPNGGAEMGMSHFPGVHHQLGGKPMSLSTVQGLKNMGMFSSHHQQGPMEGMDEPFDLSGGNVWRPW